MWCRKFALSHTTIKRSDYECTNVFQEKLKKNLAWNPEVPGDLLFFKRLRVDSISVAATGWSNSSFCSSVSFGTLLHVHRLRVDRSYFYIGFCKLILFLEKYPAY